MYWHDRVYDDTECDCCIMLSHVTLDWSQLYPNERNTAERVSSVSFINHKIKCSESLNKFSLQNTISMYVYSNLK